MEKSSLSEKRRLRAEKFAAADIYPVISSEFTKGRPAADVLKMAADGGAKLVQLREKNRTGLELYRLAEIFRNITAGYDMLLIIDDDAAVAAAVDADGVHLGQDDLPLPAARRLFPDLLLGASTHNLEEALKAQEDECDYLNVGPLFATRTKSLPMAPLGVETLDAIRPRLTVPFTVMGGIKLHHLALLREHGARRVAMVTEITEAENITETVKQLRRELLG